MKVVLGTGLMTVTRGCARRFTNANCVHHEGVEEKCLLKIENFPLAARRARTVCHELGGAKPR